MDCTEIRPLISYYYDGEATPEEQARVEQHLAECEDCRRVLAEYRVIGGGLRDLAVPAPPTGLRRDVWRAIEAHQPGAGARTTAAAAGAARRKQGKVVQFPQAHNRPALAGVLSAFESGWSRALTAALVIGALFIVLGALVFLQNRTPAPAAQLVESAPLTDYGHAIQVQFNKAVYPPDAKAYTKVYKVSGGTSPIGIVHTVDTWQDSPPGGTLVISPDPTWEPGASYEVDVQAANISLNVLGNDKLGKDTIKLQFTTAANTPTPTSSPTDTPTSLPTETPMPPTQQPTAIAENTAAPTIVVPGIEPSSTPVKVASATPVPPATQVPPAPDTATPRPVPTSTHVPPTATHVPPTSTPAPPSATPTSQPTATPVRTATPTQHPATPTPRSTATPRPSSGTPTPQPPCNLMPVNGFGKIWSAHSDVRDRVGCPVENETAVQLAAGEAFQGGYMFWRGDTKIIYVFFAGGPNDTVGTWQQFPDTWKDGDPEPTPDQPAPTGMYVPVRGFGRVWNENSNVRQLLGYATEPEQGLTAAWQTYQHGYALWTSDKVIRFMFDENPTTNIYMQFEDTFVLPTATPAP